MGDIGFEEQLEQERLAREREEAKLLESHPQTKTDPDGTVYEWDTEKKAWFPKIDMDFIAQYQMNYGVQSDETETSGETADSKATVDYESYYRHYHAAGQETTMGSKKKKEDTKEDTHEEMVEKLEQLESSLQQGEGTNGEGVEDYSKESMEKFTEEEKKQYNEYWSYYYGTEYHDYYADCMAQYTATEVQDLEGEGQIAGVKGQTDVGQIQKAEAEGDHKDEEGKEGGKKKGKKKKGGAQQQRPEGWFEVDETHNTNVYVSGLPLDVTDEEFKELMNKCGLIMYDPHTRKPKLKLYRDENGDPKGDGRCCYIKIESVDLALKILDGGDVRGKRIKVERANFHMKGDFDPSKKRKKLSNKEKRKFKEKQAKLFDWRPERPQGTRLKHEKIVILKNLFDPTAFELNPALINTVREDVRSECANYGDVKKVTVYDRHPDGVVSVTYKEAEEADLCVSSLHQRWFAKRRILASTWDGKAKYEVEETEKEREERLKKWENFLETGEKESNTKESDVINSGKETIKDSVALEAGVETSEATQPEQLESDSGMDESSTKSNASTQNAEISNKDSKSTEAAQNLSDSDNINSASEPREDNANISGEG